MHTLVDMIYSHKAQTVAGLAVQARAFSLDWIERWGDGTSEDQGTRQFADLVCAFAGVTPVALEGKTVKSFTQRPAKADPIFAAIERYKKAYERHGDTCHAVSQYEEALREADGAVPNNKNHPELKKLKQRSDRAGEAAWRATAELVQTVPTTASGVQALVRTVETDKGTLDMRLDDNRNCRDAFLRTIHTAMERIV